MNQSPLSSSVTDWNLLTYLQSQELNGSRVIDIGYVYLQQVQVC